MDAHRAQFRWAGTLLIVATSMVSTGCLRAPRDRAATLQAAVAPVLDEATAAYDEANQIAQQRQDFEAYADFNQSNPVYNPRTIQPVLSEHDIAVRVEVLRALAVYVQDVAAVLNGTDSPALRTASTAVGTDVLALGNTVAKAVDGAASTPLTPLTRNGISTAADALGQVLIAPKVRRQLPPIVERMDPSVNTLVSVLRDDITLLQGREKRDRDSLIDLQTLYIRQEQLQMNPETRRAEILKLPGLVRAGRDAEARLQVLHDALERLRQAHHALAETLRAGDRAALRQKLAELLAAGQGLGSFYGSLPTS